jgi:hypothetical protein
MELMTKWPHCSVHHGHCYVTKGGSYHGEHFNFDPREWGIWATALVHKQAVVEYPPRTEEFDIIIDKYRSAGKGKKKGSKIQDHHRSLSSSDESSKYKNVIVNITHPSRQSPPAHRYSNPTSPFKPSTKQKSVIELLRNARYNSDDYNDNALKDYLNWCHESLPGDYDTAFMLLSEQDIGIDMLDSLPDASTLSSQTKLSFGTAARILKHYREWLRVIEK